MPKKLTLLGLISLFLLAFQLIYHPVKAAQPVPEPLLSGRQALGWAGEPALSADGRMLAFISTTPGLVPSDQNTLADVFVQDRQTGKILLVSKSSAGTHANGWSYRLSLSADGRFLAFTSIADNLVAGDANGVADIFLHDLLTGETSLVSRATGGEQSNGWSDWPAVSGDGRYVAFSSAGENLVRDDTNGAVDVFVYDQLTLQTHRVSLSTAGVQGDAASGWATAISRDGRLIAFSSEAGNLAAGDFNEQRDIFLHNRVTGKTVRAPATWSTTEDYLGSDWPALSDTGAFLAFTARRTTRSVDGAGREEALLVYLPDSDELREIARASFLQLASGGGLRATISGQSLIYIGQRNSESGSTDWGISIIRLKSGESLSPNTQIDLEAGLILQPDKPASRKRPCFLRLPHR